MKPLIYLSSLLCLLPVAAMAEDAKNIPAAPEHLLVRVISGSRIHVMWTDKSDNEKGFILERKIGADGAFAALETISPNETDFKDFGIEKPGTYAYRVRAFNGDGESTNTEELAVTIAPNEPAHISPWILDRGYNKDLNLQITGESENWVLTDVAPQKLEPGYEWWYFLGGKIVKSQTNLKDEPWKGNQPGRLLKMAGKLGLDTFNKWTSNPGEVSYYYDLKAGMTFDSGTSGGVATFVFK